jgi:hypothetical protein
LEVYPFSGGNPPQGNGNNEFQGGVRIGKANNFIIHQTCSFGRCDNIEILDASLFPFGRDDPYRAVALEVTSEALELSQILKAFGRQKNNVQVFPEP